MTTAWWKEPIQQRGGDNPIAEDFSPFREAAVGGEDHRTLFIAAVDALEEQIAAAWGDRQVSDLVNNEQCGPAQIADTLT